MKTPMNEPITMLKKQFNFLSIAVPPSKIPICFSISYSNYTIKLVNNSTATLDCMRKVRTVFGPDFLTQS